MAFNINLDGFGYLPESNVSKLTTINKEQPPISPIESESSSGISSLDSDELKVSQFGPMDFFSNLHRLISHVTVETVVIFAHGFT